MKHYILKDRKPVEATWEEFTRWYGGADRHVGITTVEGCWVSTVFMGIDHSLGRGPPLLFETMVSGPNGKFTGHLDYTRRYSTWIEAELGHIMVCLQLLFGDEEAPAASPPPPSHPPASA